MKVKLILERATTEMKLKGEVCRKVVEVEIPIRIIQKQKKKGYGRLQDILKGERMTKEELKQEAEESFEQYKVTDEDYVVSPYSDDMGEKMLMYNYEYYAEETYLRFYKQGYLAGAEPREKRIAELEKENADLKEEINKIAFARGNLEEENAELKGLKDVATLIRANNDTVTTLMQLNNMLVSKNQQLTKAKELLRYYFDCFKNDNKYTLSDFEVVEDTEQFLNSEVEK